MSRHLNSEFWFLSPSKPDDLHSDANEVAQANILSEFAARGIQPNRIKFVERVCKEKHILRFELDWLVYLQLISNHLDIAMLTFFSTQWSTELIRLQQMHWLGYGSKRVKICLTLYVQGLPVLTISGDSFPSRVASSLISSFSGDDQLSYHPFDDLEKLLVMPSKKSYEDAAIRLMTCPRCLQNMRDLLQRARIMDGGENAAPPVGLFNTERLVGDFFHAMEAVGEVDRIIDRKKLNSRTEDVETKRLSAAHPHIIVGR